VLFNEVPSIAQTLFLGEDLLPLLTLAFGAALVAGNGLALVKPPQVANESVGDESDLPHAPVARTVLFIVVGTIMSVWALASLFA